VIPAETVCRSCAGLDLPAVTANASLSAATTRASGRIRVAAPRRLAYGSWYSAALLQLSTELLGNHVAELRVHRGSRTAIALMRPSYA
jgi:hypothetical protein